jgi:hypothetical protein
MRFCAKSCGSIAILLAFGDVMEWALALFLKPFVFIVLAVCVLVPARKWVERRPDSKMKRILLIRW